MVRCTHPTKHPKLHFNWFSRFCIAHGRVRILYNGRAQPSQNPKRHHDPPSVQLLVSDVTVLRILSLTLHTHTHRKFKLFCISHSIIVIISLMLTLIDPIFLPPVTKCTAANKCVNSFGNTAVLIQHLLVQCSDTAEWLIQLQPVLPKSCNNI